MKIRSSRIKQQKPTQNGKIFIQIIICVVIVCAFMMFKDVELSNGKTPKDYAEQILSTTVDLPEIIASFKEEITIPASADVK